MLHQDEADEAFNVKNTITDKDEDFRDHKEE
jgi:hypothetical protein